jgi:hypothetical protein
MTVASPARGLGLVSAREAEARGVCISLGAAVQLIFASVASLGQAQTAPPAPEVVYAPPLRQPMVAPAGPIIRLRVDNPDARLQVLQPRWLDLCAAPCGVPADPGGVYRIGGHGLRPSEPFALPRLSGEVSINATAGSTKRYWTGVGLALSGLVVGLFGYLALGAASSPDQSVDAPSDNSGHIAGQTIGVVLLVIGAALEAVGVPTWLANRTTVLVQ